MKKQLLLSLLLLMATYFTGFSQGLDSVFVQYSNPGINQNSELVADIYLTSQGAIRFGYTTRQQADTLFVTACYGSGPLTAPMRLRDTMQLGTVPSHIQQLHFRAYYSRDFMQCDSAVFLEKTVAFSVRKPMGVAKFRQVPVLSFYPNPVQEMLTIENGPFAKITIRELTGKVIFTQAAGNETTQKLDLGGLPAGLYLLETVLKNGDVSRARLVKN